MLLNFLFKPLPPQLMGEGNNNNYLNKNMNKLQKQGFYRSNFLQIYIKKLNYKKNNENFLLFLLINTF